MTHFGVFFLFTGTADSNPKRRIKTKLCYDWLHTGGKCPRGSQCDFAHGVAELRVYVEPRNRKFRTKLCRYRVAVVYHT